MKRFVLMVTAALVIAALAAAPALAEGLFEQGPEHARSICSFSGLNDDPEEPFPEDGRVQSYGQLVSKGFKDNPEVPSPGFACNPNNISGPFPEDVE